MSDIKPVYRFINNKWIKHEAYEIMDGKWVQISSLYTDGIGIAFYTSDNNIFMTSNGDQFLSKGG